MMTLFVARHALAGLFLLPASVAAQSQDEPPHIRTMAIRQLREARQEMLLGPARLVIRDVGMAEAIEALMQAASVRIAYSSSLLPVARRVSCDCATGTVAAALDSLFAGLRYQWTETAGQILLEPTAPIREQVAPAGIVTGTVTDEISQRPIAGAQVMLTGTRTGAVTNEAGVYTIGNVPPGSVTITVRRIGYAPMERTAVVAEGQPTTVNFALVVQVRTLSEVVVTGTVGATTRREIGNSISAVRMDALEDSPTPQVEDIIGARVPGAAIIRNEGVAGAGASIRVRGINSLTQGNRPLIYVDGIRMYSEALPSSAQGQSSSPLNDIDPNDIERIEIGRASCRERVFVGV